MGINSSPLPQRLAAYFGQHSIVTQLSKQDPYSMIGLQGGLAPRSMRGRVQGVGLMGWVNEITDQKQIQLKRMLLTCLEALLWW